MLNIYLNFKGNAKEAVKTYEEAFNTKLENARYFSEMPPSDGFKINEEEMNNIMYSQMDISGSTIMISDVPSNYPEEIIVGNNATLTVQMDNPNDVRHAFDVLARDGRVTMPLEKTFFSELYGSVEDAYGIHWAIMIADKDYQYK